MQVTSLLLVVSCLAVQIHALSQPTSPSVVLDAGVKLVGSVVPDYEGIHFYGGIRYAAAPVGALRWAPPVPYMYSEEEKASGVDSSK